MVMEMVSDERCKIVVVKSRQTYGSGPNVPILVLLFACKEHSLLFSPQKCIRELALVGDALPGGSIDWCMYVHIYFYLRHPIPSPMNN